MTDIEKRALENIELEGKTRQFVASVISIGEQDVPNDIYMSIRMKMFTADKRNANGVAVTERFMDEIIENQEKYRCIPLCADVRKIENGDLEGLGHMLDAKTGVFYSQQIGSFYSFEKQIDQDGVTLVGTARIAKRNKKVIEALTHLFAEGKLNFSFEILVGETTSSGGTEIIDASERNHLIAMAVVTHGADRNARALAMVAEQDEEQSIQRLFEKATIAEVAEISVETLQNWVYRAVNSFFGEESFWNIIIERVGPTATTIYDVSTGQTFKMEYFVQDDALVITDIYECELTRKDGVETLKDKNTLAEQVEETVIEQAEVEQPEVETPETETPETAEEEVQEEVETTETETAETEEEEVEAEEPETETASTQEEVEIDTLRQRMRALEEELEKKGAIIASFELAEKQKKATKVAQRAGLDLDDEAVKAVIEKGDLAGVATIVAELETEDNTVEEPTDKVNPFVAEIKLERRDHSYMYESAEK